MNSISNDLLSAPIWSPEKEAEQMKGTVADAKPSGDTVTISFEAAALAASEQAEGAAAPESSYAELEWGPDLIEGWDDANYLRVEGGGFVGSLSMTTAKGTKVGITAETNEDGSPAKSVLVTIQTADGAMQRHRLEERTFISNPTFENGVYRSNTEFFNGFLRITETEKGIEIEKDGFAIGTDGDDIIITMGTGASGGKGNDTLISLGHWSEFAVESKFGEITGTEWKHVSDGIKGGDGDDTLVALGRVQTNDIEAGDGNDTIFARAVSENYGIYQSIYTGTGNNQVTIDRFGGDVKFDRKDWRNPYQEGDVTNNTIFIKEFSGWIRDKGSRSDSMNISLNIDTAKNLSVILDNSNLSISVNKMLHGNIRSINSAITISKAFNTIYTGDGITINGGSRNIETSDEELFRAGLGAKGTDGAFEMLELRDYMKTRSNQVRLAPDNVVLYYLKTGELDHDRSRKEANRRGYEYHPENYTDYAWMDLATGQVSSSPLSKDQAYMKELADRVIERYQAEQAKIDKTTAQLRQKKTERVGEMTQSVAALYGNVKQQSIAVAQNIMEQYGITAQGSMAEELLDNLRGTRLLG